MMDDLVNSPSHYTEGRRFKTIEVIDDWQLDYYLGNVVKYVSKAGREENFLEDLRKAQWYLSRRIMKEEKNEQLKQYDLFDGEPHD